MVRRVFAILADPGKTKNACTFSTIFSIPSVGLSSYCVYDAGRLLPSVNVEQPLGIVQVTGWPVLAPEQNAFTAERFFAPAL
ncbi:hypothetical protein [Labrys neptuniae]